MEDNEKIDDSNIKLHIWDIIYFNKPIDGLPLIKRINYLNKLKFNERVKEVERTIIKDKKDLEKSVNWATSLKDSEGAVAKYINEPYHFGEHSSWKKFRHLTSLVVIVLKKVPKKRNLYNYLVGIPATKKFLDKKYISDNKLVLGHSFNTDKIFEVNDKIEILIEEVWRHETKTGIHYSIHKPRVKDKTDKPLTSIDALEDIVTSIGVAVMHTNIDNYEVLISDQLAEREEPKDEGKEIEVKDFPDRMQANFESMIDKWGNYVMQIHTRGKTAHYDIRHKVKSNLLEGITLFARSIEDRLPIETEKNNIRSTIKVPQPLDWLTFEGVTKSRGVGATKRFPGVFTIISKGKFTIHEVTDHKVVIEYKSDKGKINTKMFKTAEALGAPVAKDLPDDLIDLTGKYSWHIAHIGDHYIILFDRLKE